MRASVIIGGVVRVALLAALSIPAAGCVHLFQSRPSHYIQIADGLTAATLTEGIRLAPLRMTPFEFTAACRQATPIARFTLTPASLEMTAGGRYSLESLSIVGVNSADVAVPGIPFVIEAEELPTPVIALRSDDEDLRKGVLRALAPGTFKVRIRTTCGMPYVEAWLVGRVAG